MDIGYDCGDTIRRCFKCNENVISNLNVINNKWNTTFTLWNKFQIFVYEDLEFGSASKVIVPEFQIHNLITSSNYLICVDYTGNVHTTSLKFKNVAQKRFKYGFQPREISTMVCSLFNEDYMICLKHESGAYFLSVHKMNTDFSLEKRAIVFGYEHLPSQQKREKYLLKTYPINESHLGTVEKVFNVKDVKIRNNYNIVIISFDSLSVYSCLFSSKMTAEEVSLVKLYTCPSEIASIELIEMDDLIIVIGLTIGTLICLNLKDIKAPDIIHLNTALYKFSVFKDTILYTDGLVMWKAEKILSTDITFSQLFVKDVKDFVKFGDQVICTTFKDLIYTFSLDDETSYIKPQSIEEYCSAERLRNTAEYLETIMVEVVKANTLMKLLNNERNYITALSVSNRQDVMDEIVHQKVTVYEKYEDVISENSNVILTNNVSEYFDAESFYFLINVTCTEDLKIGEVLSNSIGDLRFHITLASKSRMIKTTTVVTCFLRKIKLLVPLKTKFIDTAEMRVHTKIITNIPGSLDPKQKIWTVLYRNTVLLNSEHFIKLNYNSSACSLKPKVSLETLILHTTINQYGNIFDFTDIIEERTTTRQWQMYVRLPAQYQRVFKNESTRRMFTSKKEEYILEQFSSEEFLKSNISLPISIGKEKVIIELDDDGFSIPTLKISSDNVKVALHMRNFLSNLIYSVFADFQPGKEFISHSFYVTVENLQKAVAECVTNPSEEDMLILIEQFERKIIGWLPI